MYSHYLEANAYRILGIDPGTNTLGTAIIDIDLITKRMTVAHATTYVGQSMACNYKAHEEVHGPRAARLKAHEENLLGLLHEWKPHTVICESAYMGRFAQAYMALVECICAIEKALYRYNPAMPLLLVDPTTVKKTTGMTGRLRGKDPVREAIASLDCLHFAKGMHLNGLDEHSVDALAVAYVRASEVMRCLEEAPNGLCRRT